MTLDELVQQFRSDADDRAGTGGAGDYLFETADIWMWLNEAQDEAADRALLLHETSLAAICTIAVTAPTTVYALDDRILNITRAAFTPTGTTQEYILTPRDVLELDRIRPNWRQQTDVPRDYIHDSTTLRLGCIPSTDGTIQLECYRLPLANIEDTATETPEIHRQNHRALVHWALYRGYSRPDSEVFDPDRAAKELARFERVFGLKVDAKLRRNTNANRPLVNKAVW